MAETKPKKKQKKADRYKGIKYLGYRTSQLPDPFSMRDLVRYAKFVLAHKAGKLLKDPIWDLYTVEELLMEFYAHQFYESKELRVEFEQSLTISDAVVDDFAAWADKQIAEEGKIRDRLMGEAEDNISFGPDDVLGDEE